jgi:hypothetical protein
MGKGQQQDHLALDCQLVAEEVRLEKKMESWAKNAGLYDRAVILLLSYPVNLSNDS